MNRETKFVIGISAFITVASVSGVYFYRSAVDTADVQQLENTAPGREADSALIRADSHRKGPEKAQVTVVEFLDPECEACRAFHPVVKKILEENRDTTRIVTRYMAFHSSSAYAIAALEAAGKQEKYWEMLDLLFDKQSEWGHRMVPDMTPFYRYATALGLDETRFSADMKDPRNTEIVSRDLKDGESLGVRGTPTFFVNGRRLDELNEDALRGAISAAMSKKDQTNP